MKGVYREKLFYGIQHLENFLLIFFLVPHRAVPDLQRMKRPFSDAIFFYIWRPSRMFYALVSIQAPLGTHRVRPLAGPMAGSAIQSPRMDSTVAYAPRTRGSGRDEHRSQ